MFKLKLPFGPENSSKGPNEQHVTKLSTLFRMYSHISRVFLKEFFELIVGGSAYTWLHIYEEFDMPWNQQN